MSSQDDKGNVGPVNCHGASATPARRDPPRAQKMAVYNVSVTVVFTLTLAAAAAVVVITFLYWMPETRHPGDPKNSADENDIPKNPKGDPLEGKSAGNKKGDPGPAPRGDPEPEPKKPDDKRQSSGSDSPPPADPQPKPTFLDDELKSLGSDPPDSDINVDDPESAQSVTPPHPRRPAYPIMTLQETPPTVYSQGYRSSEDSNFRILLHGPHPTTVNGETPLYDRESKRAFCAVTAGSANLDLSASLSNMLLDSVRATSSQISPKEFNRLITATLTHIAKEARRHPQALVQASLEQNPVFKEVYAYIHRLSGWEENHFGGYATLVILGVLTRPCHVHGRRDNRFLLIAIPPIENRSNRHFPRAYRNTYRNVLTIVSMYNKQHPDDSIKQLRIPLLRAQRSSLSEAALASLAAPAMYLQARRTQLTAILDLTWNPQNTFFYEMQKLLSPKEQSPDARKSSRLPKPEHRPTASHV